jgi:hypothetical protein
MGKTILMKMDFWLDNSRYLTILKQYEFYRTKDIQTVCLRTKIVQRPYYQEPEISGTG